MAPQQICSDVKILEDCYVAPPPGSVPTTTTPFSYLDVQFLNFPPVQCIFFLEFPHPTLHFTETILPTLKSSLSFTLQNYFPFAGNVVHPPHPQPPHSLYNEGDALHIRVAESTLDFNHVIGDHGRKIRELQSLLTKFKQPWSNGEEGCMVHPAMTIQVTVFPNSGVSIGFSYSHMLADGIGFATFWRSWTSNNVALLQGDLNNRSIVIKPFHKRNLIGDPSDKVSLLMKQSREYSLKKFNYASEKLQITVKFSRPQVEILKSWVKGKSLAEDNSTDSLRISTFVVSSAYIWTCLVKFTESREARGSSDDARVCLFNFMADCRNHMKLPITYFGNCLDRRFGVAKWNELAGENGFFVAAKAIGSEIVEFEIRGMRGVELWAYDANFLDADFFGLAGSPKLQAYGTNFGWGKMKKLEVAHIGLTDSLAISDSGDKGSVEFGLVLDENEVEMFNTIFEQGFLLMK